MDGTPALHQWFYCVVREVCFDREYLFRSFVDAFSSFMSVVYTEGTVTGGGEHLVTGLKSDTSAVIRWSLDRQVSFHGPNLLRVRARYRDGSGRTTGEEPEAAFDLSTGEAVPS